MANLAYCEHFNSGRQLNGIKEGFKTTLRFFNNNLALLEQKSDRLISRLTTLALTK